jgi:hypothetical protein
MLKTISFVLIVIGFFGSMLGIMAWMGIGEINVGMTAELPESEQYKAQGEAMGRRSANARSGKVILVMSLLTMVGGVSTLAAIYKRSTVRI